MSYIEEISWMSKSGYSDIELLEYIYINTLMRLNVNLMGKSIKSQRSMIVIFVWTVNQERL